MTWGAYTQQGDLAEIDSLGSELSMRINCPVHYPAYNKNLFECRCGVIFPLYIVRGNDWDTIIKKHDDEKESVKCP